MSHFASLTLADRISLSLDGLARSVAGRVVGRVMSAAMIVLIWTRVKRVEREIRALLLRFQAGRLRVAASRSGTRFGGRCVGARALPQGFGWLLPLVPGEAAGFAAQISTLLAEPEMVALLGASPRARRVLRPLCRMLGIERGMIAPPAFEAAAPDDVRRIAVVSAGEIGLLDAPPEEGPGLWNESVGYRVRRDVRLE